MAAWCGFTVIQVNKVIAPLFIHGPRAEWHRPIRLDQLLTLKEEKTQSQIVAGGLTLGTGGDLIYFMLSCCN